MHGTARGGDCDELRLLSDETTFLNLRAHGGSFSFLGTKVRFSQCSIIPSVQFIDSFDNVFFGWNEISYSYKYEYQYQYHVAQQWPQFKTCIRRLSKLQLCSLRDIVAVRNP